MITVKNCDVFKSVKGKYDSIIQLHIECLNVSMRMKMDGWMEGKKERKKLKFN